MRGQAPQAPGGRGTQRSVAGTGTEVVIHLGVSKDLSLANALGEVFELSQPRVNEWVHRLLPILKVALDELEVLPEQDPQHFAQSEPQHGERPELIIDGTERRRQRPKSPAKQADAYSGKKKTHCDKNVVLVQAKTKRVGFLSQTYAGKTHDKKIVDTEPITYPPETILYKDTGFQGYEPVVAQTYQPKKSPGRENSRRPRSGRTEQSPASGSGSNMPWRG